MKFNVIKGDIEGLYIIESKIFKDSRGFFMEAYNKLDFRAIGIDEGFVQDNHSKSRKGVLRGLHFQYKYPQGKLVRVIKGEVFDVAVDLRGNSKTYGNWFGLILSEDNKKQLYIPKGFAHGFLVLSEEAEIIYKCSEYYHSEDYKGIIWNDPIINIKWPLDRVDELILSDKDKSWKTLKETGIKFTK